MAFTDEQRRRHDMTMSKLLEFTNERYPSCAFFSGPIDSDEKVHRGQRIALDLWEHAEIIDDFVAQCRRGGTGGDAALAQSWKHFLRGPFRCLRTAGEKALLMCEGYVFEAYSLNRPWESLAPITPDLVYTTLVPFEGRIAIDGFVVHSTEAMDEIWIARLQREVESLQSRDTVRSAKVFAEIADHLEARRRKLGIDGERYRFMRNFAEYINWPLADPVFHYEITDRIRCA